MNKLWGKDPVNMDTFQLKCFVAVAEQLSFANAAHSLYMEPSTLSKIISKLEHEIGVRLFERTNRKVRLTAAGSVFLSDAKEMIEIHENCLVKTKAVAEGSMGNVNVCYCGDIEYSILPNATRRFLQEYPETNVQFFRYTWRQMYNYMNFRQMDLGVLLSFGLPEFPEYEYCPICEDPFVAVLPYDHPLAGRENLSISELEHEQFIFASKEMNLSTFHYSLNWIFPSEIHPKILNRDDCAEATNLKIAAGLGVGIVTMLARRSEPMLRYVPLRDVPPAQLIAMWMSDNNNPMIERYIAALKAEDLRWNNK